MHFFVPAVDWGPETAIRLFSPMIVVPGCIKFPAAVQIPSGKGCISLVKDM
jgi:hypothetical protein